jgi:hypothetical protein
LGIGLFLFAGCASVDPGRLIQVEQHELDGPALAMVCNHGGRDNEPGLLGCYDWNGEVCHIYTLPRWVLDQRRENGYHETLGHEVDHCIRGLFHGQDKGVALPRAPRLF